MIVFLRGKSDLTLILRKGSPNGELCKYGNGNWIDFLEWNVQFNFYIYISALFG